MFTKSQITTENSVAISISHRKLNQALELVLSEAATRGVLWKKVFLKISQNSQENTCARVFFLIKLHATYVYRTTMLAASVTTCYKCLQSLRYKIESNVTISISHGKSNHTLELKLYLLIPVIHPYRFIGIQRSRSSHRRYSIKSCS